MIEAVMIWNEPNNKSHWDFQLDPTWSRFAEMAKLAGDAIRAEHPTLTARARRHLTDRPGFIGNMASQGVLEHVDAVAMHGFPLDWNHWQLDEWPRELAEIQAVTDLPVWISEVGVSTFGADWVQDLGLRRTVELLRGKAPRIHWYSLLDLPRAWPATTRHREAEGSSYYRHFYMGVIREDGTAKPARGRSPRSRRTSASASGSTSRTTGSTTRCAGSIDARKYLRTGLSWSDYAGRMPMAWFDRQMKALEHVRRHRDILLHARGRRVRAALHQPAAPPRGVRRVLRAR